MGEARRSVEDEDFSGGVEDAAPWSFLALEFLKLSGGVRRFFLCLGFMLGSVIMCARRFTGPGQKNFSEAKGAGAALKNCSALDCGASGLLVGKRTFASGRSRVREEGLSCA